MRPRICIIQFPGVNCEYETAMALSKVGMEPFIVRWNEPASNLTRFDGFILPGGFSYEDRVRAGAIAASEDIMEAIMKQASLGKPVVGICNGAQILVETGLVPGLEAGRIDLALAPNKGMGRDGYYANWVFVRVASVPHRSVITCDLEADEILPMPIAHSQGRFTSSEPSLFHRLEGGGQIVLKYCKPDGSRPSGFPDDPNGSEGLAAAISNVEGNVVAMMPHPERSAWLRQVAYELDSVWSRRKVDGRGSWRSMESDGPGAKILGSIRRYIEEHMR